MYIQSFRGSHMDKSFTAGRWKLEETEGGCLKFGSVNDVYSGVLAQVRSGRGDLRAAVTGCSLGWLDAGVGAEAACSQRAGVTLLAPICVGDLGIDRGVKKNRNERLELRCFWFWLGLTLWLSLVGPATLVTCSPGARGSWCLPMDVV